MVMNVISYNVQQKMKSQKPSEQSEMHNNTNAINKQYKKGGRNEGVPFEKYSTLIDDFIRARNAEEIKLLAEIQKTQDEVGSTYRDGDNLYLYIDLENQPDDMGITLGDIKELYGIKDYEIGKYNSRLFESKENLPENLDDVVVGSGEVICLKMDSIGEVDYENYDYQLKSLNNDDFDVEEAQLSDEMLDNVKEWEGLYLEAYYCPSGVLTIGYGHTGDVYEGQTCTEEEAEEYLKQDMKYFEDKVKEYYQNGIIGFDLNQNQFDALVSFAFNCGEGALENLVKGKEPEEIAEIMPKYCHDSDGNVLPGLATRREAEVEWFMS